MRGLEGKSLAFSDCGLGGRSLPTVKIYKGVFYPPMPHPCFEFSPDKEVIECRVLRNRQKNKKPQKIHDIRRIQKRCLAQTPAPPQLPGVSILYSSCFLPRSPSSPSVPVLKGTDAPRRTPRSNKSLTALFTSVSTRFTLELLRIFSVQSL